MTCALLADNNDGFHEQELFEEINLEKKSTDDKHKHAKLPSMQRFFKGPYPEYSRAYTSLQRGILI